MSNRAVAVMLDIVNRHAPTTSGASALARALSRIAQRHPHSFLGTDGDGLLERACRIAADDRDERQAVVLRMLLRTTEAAVPAEKPPCMRSFHGWTRFDRFRRSR